VYAGSIPTLASISPQFVSTRDHRAATAILRSPLGPLLRIRDVRNRNKMIESPKILIKLSHITRGRGGRATLFSEF
jgi:hypothetical protein